MMRVIGAILGVCLVVVVWVGYVRAVEKKAAVPIIEVDTAMYDFHEAVQGEVVRHDFRVFNRGTAPLEIKKVKPV